MLGLINPADSAAIEKATGKQGVGKPASLVCGDLNPNSLANRENAHNTLSVVSAQMVTLPPKSQVVVMGRLSNSRQGQDLPRSVVVEPVPTKNPGVYVARVVSNVFVKTGSEFYRLLKAPRGSLREKTGEKEPGGVHREKQGVPGKERGVRAVITPESLGDHDNTKDRELCYCMVEMINTSASIVEIGKNVKLGDGEPLMLRGDEVIGNEVRAGHEDKENNEINDVEELEKYGSGRQNNVCHVSEKDDGLNKVIMRKLEHLVKAEKEVLGPVMMKYYDLFLYDRSGLLPCTGKGFHEIKTGDALPIKKNPNKVPFVLRAEMKRTRRDGTKRCNYAIMLQMGCARDFSNEEICGRYSKIQILY